MPGKGKVKLQVGFLIVLALSWYQVSAFPAAGQGYSGMQNNSIDLQEDSQKAEESRRDYEAYRERVSEYVRTVEERCSDARLQRLDVEKRYQKLAGELKHLSGSQRSAAESQLAAMHEWLQSEANISTEAAKNIDLCQRYLQHSKDQCNIDAHNANADEQTIEDGQRRQREVQSQLAWQQLQTQNRAYWDSINNPPDNWGGGGYRGYRGHSYNGHSWSSHSGGGGHSSAHVSGGHISHR